MFDQQQVTLKGPLTSLHPIRKKHHLKEEEVLFDEDELTIIEKCNNHITRV